MHSIQAIIVQGTACETRFEEPTVRVALPQGYWLIPVNDSFYKAKCGAQSPSVIENFVFLTPEFHAWLASASLGRMLAYIETEYFGGDGGQGAVVFSDGKCIYGPSFMANGPINEALRLIGVSVSEREFDEFEALDLGKYRTTSAWLSSID